jgi:hypothetical protein
MARVTVRPANATLSRKGAGGGDVAHTPAEPRRRLGGAGGSRALRTAGRARNGLPLSFISAERPRTS